MTEHKGSRRESQDYDWIIYVTILLFIVLGIFVCIPVIISRKPPETGTPTSIITQNPTLKTTFTPTFTLTNTPITTFTPSPTPTDTPTATFIPSAKLTDTPTPSSTPTGTPMATPTPSAKPTSTPTKTLSPTSIHAPTLYPPPKLIGEEFAGCNVTLKWEWDGTLAQDEWFAVRVGTPEPHSVEWVKGYEYIYPLSKGGQYYWEIAICKGRPEDHKCSKEAGNELAVSERRTFSFVGCGPVRP